MNVTDRVRVDIEQSVYAQVRSVQVYSNNGFVVLNGEVDCYFIKQLAQEIAMRYSDSVINMVVVRKGDET